MEQVERIWSHEVSVQEAAERHHEAQPRPEDRGNQMGVYGEGHPGQARLQGPVGCARGVKKTRAASGQMRPLDRETPSCMTLSAAAQDGRDYNVFDAQSAYLQSNGIERLLLLRMLHKKPPPGTKPGQVYNATGSIYGTGDAGRAWYEHSKKVLETAGFMESRLEQGFCYLHGPSGLEAVAHTHADDFLVAFKKASKRYKDALQHLVQRASLEATVWHDRVLWPDHLQRWQSHQDDSSNVNAEP